MSVVSLHLLLNLEVLIRQSLANLLRFQSNHVFERVLFLRQNRHLLLVNRQLLSQSSQRLLQKAHDQPLSITDKFDYLEGRNLSPDVAGVVLAHVSGHHLVADLALVVRHTASFIQILLYNTFVSIS